MELNSTRLARMLIAQAWCTHYRYISHSINNTLVFTRDVDGNRTATAWSKVLADIESIVWQRGGSAKEAKE